MALKYACYDALFWYNKQMHLMVQAVTKIVDAFEHVPKQINNF